jgi:hypothetical protein
MAGDDVLGRFVERYRAAGYDDGRIAEELAKSGFEVEAVRAALAQGAGSTGTVARSPGPAKAPAPPQEGGQARSGARPSEGRPPAGSSGGCMYPPCGRCGRGFLLPFFLKDGTNFYACTSCRALFGPKDAVPSLIGFGSDVSSGRARVEYLVPP